THLATAHLAAHLAGHMAGAHLAGHVVGAMAGAVMARVSCVRCKCGGCGQHRRAHHAGRDDLSERDLHVEKPFYLHRPYLPADRDDTDESLRLLSSLPQGRDIAQPRALMAAGINFLHHTGDSCTHPIDFLRQKFWRVARRVSQTPQSTQAQDSQGGSPLSGCPPLKGSIDRPMWKMTAAACAIALLMGVSSGSAAPNSTRTKSLRVQATRNAVRKPHVLTPHAAPEVRRIEMPLPESAADLLQELQAVEVFSRLQLSRTQMASA